MPQPSWSPSTTQQLRKLVAAPYLASNDWTPRSEAYFVSLWHKARRENSAASRLLGTTSLCFALHGWQRQWAALLFRKRDLNPIYLFRPAIVNLFLVDMPWQQLFDLFQG
ncbi:hypothetical protein, partial [Thiolapillus sp.]